MLLSARWSSCVEGNERNLSVLAFHWLLPSRSHIPSRTDIGTQNFWVSAPCPVARIISPFLGLPQSCLLNRLVHNRGSIWSTPPSFCFGMGQGLFSLSVGRMSRCVLLTRQQDHTQPIHAHTRPGGGAPKWRNHVSGTRNCPWWQPQKGSTSAISRKQGERETCWESWDARKSGYPVIRLTHRHEC